MTEPDPVGCLLVVVAIAIAATLALAALVLGPILVFKAAVWLLAT